MKVNYAALIRQSLNMGEVAQYYGLQFNRAGFSLCPFHAEKTPSFKVQNSQYAHCFGCGWHGDAISFVMELLGLPFQAACERLNNDFGLGLPITRKPTLREQRDATARWRKIQAERERQEQIKQRYEAMYHRLWDEYARLDLQRMRCVPTDPNEDFDPLYVEAVKKIDYIEYLIDELL
jgi:DNA primase